MRFRKDVFFSSIFTGLILGLIFGYIFMGYIVEKKIVKTVHDVNDYVKTNCGNIPNNLAWEIDDINNTEKFNTRLPDHVKPFS